MRLFGAPGLKRTLLLGLPAAIVLLLAASAYWLMHTASGAAWVWSRVEGLEGVNIGSSQASGDLADGFHVRNLTYRSDGFDLTAAEVELRLQLQWWPLTIVVHELSLADSDVFIQAGEPGAQPTGGDADVRSVLAGVHLPLPLEIREVLVSRINLRRDGDPDGFLIDSLSFGVSLDRQLVVDHFDIVAQEFEAGLQARLELAAPFGLVIDAQGRYEIPAYGGKPAQPMPFTLEIAGDLDKLKFTLTSPETGLQAGGDILDPVNNLRWNITATLDELELPEEMAGQRISLFAVGLVSEGDVDGWSFGLDANVLTDALQETKLAVSGTGTAGGIEISDASLAGPGLDVGVSGRLDWSEHPEAAVRAIIGRLDPSPWLAAWPAGEPLTGALELNWSGSSLQIPEGRLNVESTGTSVDISADIDIETNRVQARLDWRNLAWPLTGGADALASKSGRLDISGTADDWLVNGLLDIRLGDYPEGRFELSGGGNRSSAHLKVPRGEILGGSISGEAGADWSGALNWDATVIASGIDPGPVVAEWPGRLNGRVSIQSQQQPRLLLIDLDDVDGELRGVPVSANGGIGITDGGVDFKALEVHTDEALLVLDGAFADPAGARIKFDGTIPPELTQGAHGKIRMEARYSSSDTSPLLEMQLQAQDLFWSGINIGSLAVSTAAPGSAGPLPAMQLTASALAWNKMVLDDLSLGFKPVNDNVEVKLALADKDVKLNGLMTLTPESMQRIFNTRWSGVLAEFAVDLGPAYHFELLNPASFSWSVGSVSVEPVCLAETTGASLCVAYDDRGNGNRSLVADATAVPLDYMRDYFGLDVHFEQSLEGHMEWHQLNGAAPTGGAEFRVTAGRILDLLDDEVLAQTKEGRLAFTLQNGNLESGVLDIEFPGNGFIDLDFDILDIVGEGPQRIQGRAVARLDKLTLAGQMAFPGVDVVDGRFESDIHIGGTPMNPEFEGGFRISNGLFNYAPIGMKLEDIEIEGKVIRRDRGDFKGRFRAGEGMASIDGHFLFDDAGSAKLVVDLAGGPLLLVNTDALKIHTQTELEVAVSRDRVDVNGQITIPEARLTPANLRLEEVRDSEDLVIETYREEPGNASQKPTTRQRFYGQLDVTLGDGVFVKVPGIETTIKGSTRFNWSGDPVPLAQGAYSIHGMVDIYGPKLQINNGSVSFPGVPADNPNLNIRAGRDIYGNTQIRSAGVQMIGTLKHPVLEAYTVPVTNEDRAWTLLVTGTDFDQAQGVSGFDLGTYIAPKLYVSYGISLFEDENVISARYDLKKGWGVKVTSGQRETGLDVSYTIDR